MPITAAGSCATFTPDNPSCCSARAPAKGYRCPVSVTRQMIGPGLEPEFAAARAGADRLAPGVEAPGVESAGVVATGVVAAGVVAAGVVAPGVVAPGVESAGVLAPGVESAGVREIGFEAPPRAAGTTESGAGALVLTFGNSALASTRSAPVFAEPRPGSGTPIGLSQPKDSPASGIVVEPAAVDGLAAVAPELSGAACPPATAPVSDLTVTRAPPPVDSWTGPVEVRVDGSDSPTTMSGGPSAG